MNTRTVIFGMLFDVFKRQQERLVDLKPVDLLVDFGDSRLQVDVWMERVRAEVADSPGACRRVLGLPPAPT